MVLGQILDSYAFFSARNWRVVEPGKSAEFRGEMNISDYNEADTRAIDRLKSKNLQDTFRSLTFVAPMTLAGDTADSPEPYVEAVFQDGSKERQVWKDPPYYYWDRISKNRKIKIDYFINRAVQNPKYGRSQNPANQDRQ